MDETAEPRAAGLPAWPTSFVGRETELAQLGAALAGGRLVTLTGAGGFGKTRLAVRAAADAAASHSDGVQWVDLTPAWTKSVVAYDVAQAFGVVADGDAPIFVALCEELAGSDALLVLDHCDAQLERCAEVVDALLQSTPRLHVLTTSREPLGVPDELLCRVPSLDLPAGTRLFGERAAQVEPGFHAVGEAGEAVGEICHRLDGVPLAIELAAARVKDRSPAWIADSLQTWLQARTNGSTGGVHPAVEAVIEWSYHLLDDTERRLLQRLSVFAGGFTVEGAEEVCSGGGVEREAVAPALRRLCLHAMVEGCPTGPEGRYRIPETIRERAAAALAEVGQSDASRERHRDYFVALAERAEPRLVLEDGPAWLDRLEDERHNLIVVSEWCESTGAYEPLLRLLTALTLFFELRLHLRAGRRWFDRALAADDGPSSVRARALWGAAHLALSSGDVKALGRYGPEALTMAEEVGDDAALCRALNVNGTAEAWLSANVVAGRDMLERSATLGRKLGDEWALAEGLRQSTLAWMVQGRYDDLVAPLAEFGRVAERLGSRFLIAWYHAIIGWARLQRGDFPRARRILEIAVAEDLELGGAATAGIPAALLGEGDALTGRYADAEARLSPFLRQGIGGNRFGAAWALPILGRLLVGVGRPDEARAVIEPFLDQLRPIGVPLHVAEAWGVLGGAHAGAGDDDAAEAAFTEVRALACAINNPSLMARADHHLGNIARRRGDLAAALRLHHQALKEQTRVGLRPGIAESLEALAAVACDRERFVEAARLFSVAAGLRRGMGLARWPVDKPGYDADVDTVRRALGEPRFQISWAEGAALTIDEAISHAGSGAGSP